MKSESDNISQTHIINEMPDSPSSRSENEDQTAHSLLKALQKTIKRYNGYSNEILVMIPTSDSKVLSMRTSNGRDVVISERHRRYTTSSVKQWINTSSQDQQNANHTTRLNYRKSYKSMKQDADSYVNQIYNDICQSFPRVEGNVKNMSVTRSQLWSRTKNWWKMDDHASDWMEEAKKVTLDAAVTEQSGKLGHFMAIVSRALVVHKLKQFAEQNVWLQFAKDCGIDSPSSWSSLGEMFVIMFPGCLEESGPNKQDFESGRALTNSPVRFLGWSYDVWFRFAASDKYLFTLFPAINRFMSDHANQPKTSSSPVSVHLSVSDDSSPIDSIAQTSSDEDRTSSDDDNIPFSQPSGKRQRKH